MFARDRDVLALEPTVHVQLPFLGQTLMRGTGSVTGGILTLTSGSFAFTGLAAGYVVVVDRTPLEVIDVLSATTMAVSLLRDSESSAVRRPTDGLQGGVLACTFMPQIAMVHRQLLAMINVKPTAGPDGSVGESAITNPQELSHLEAIGALHLVYAAASAASPQSLALMQRTQFYKDRFALERWRVCVELDLDGDGLADARRSFQVAHLARA